MLISLRPGKPLEIVLSDGTRLAFHEDAAGEYLIIEKILPQVFDDTPNPAPSSIGVVVRVINRDTVEIG